MKKVIISGSNGFVGSALCRELSKNGVEIIAIVRNKKSNIEGIKDLKHLRIVYCDLNNFKNLSKMVPDRNIDIMYHFAWMGSAGTLRGDKDIQIDNIRYTCDAIQACHGLDCKKFVFAASIMEYEIQASIQHNKSLGINSLYSIAKTSADYMLKALAKDMGMEYLRCIISNIYGPGEKSPRLINTTLRRMLNGEHCSFSSGEQIYDFIYIDDAARAFVAIGEKGQCDQTYYIGSQKPSPLKEFLLEMKAQVNPALTIGLGEIPFHGVSLSYKEFDIGLVEKHTGFVPEISFSEGIQQTIKWLKKEQI